MSLDDFKNMNSEDIKYIDHEERTFHIRCKGRNRMGKEVLTKPIKAKVGVYKTGGIGPSVIRGDVNCDYRNRDYRGRGMDKCRCKAVIAAKQKGGQGICPYIFQVPLKPYL